MSERADRERAAKPGRPWGHMLLQFTLARMPELELFESDEQRKRALSEIGREAGRPSSWQFVLAIVILVIAVFTVGQATEWVCAHFDISSIELPAKLITMGLTFMVTIRALHRWGSREELRSKLLEFGIPVCTKCGYSLRGLSLEIDRCPECGATFDDRVREILAAADGETRDGK